MTAWVLVVQIASAYHGFITIPGIASKQECERLYDVLIENFPHHTYSREVYSREAPPNPHGSKSPGVKKITSPEFDPNARCLPYEIASNETQARH
jgi:hypothetical protein